MPTHLDIFPLQFNKTGEELCGDTIRLQSTHDRTILVLSDGLGSGVKANILSTMTAAILLTMLSADAPLDETVGTVIGTLPVCQVRKLAYATFTVVKINNLTGDLEVVNFDNPRIVWLKNRKLIVPPRQMRQILDRQVFTFTGKLEENDFLGIFSDGILHAGLGQTLNLGWGWESVARYIEQSAQHEHSSSRSLVQHVMQRVLQLYGDHIGDDCSFVGILARHRRTLVILTGPPLDRTNDEEAVDRFFSIPGRHIICGGTTGNIVGRYLDQTPEVLLSSMRPDIPPVGRLREVDLVTEGILTMNKAADLLRDALATNTLPDDPNGAVLLAREMLHADTVHFLVGRRINDFYQNPDLPPNLSLRRNMVNELMALLRSAGKQVNFESF